MPRTKDKSVYKSKYRARGWSNRYRHIRISWEYHDHEGNLAYVSVAPVREDGSPDTFGRPSIITPKTLKSHYNRLG